MGNFDKAFLKKITLELLYKIAFFLVPKVALCLNQLKNENCYNISIQHLILQVPAYSGLNPTKYPRS